MGKVVIFLTVCVIVDDNEIIVNTAIHNLLTD